MISDRQMRFVQEYCKDFVATSAYIRAGYSENGAAQGAHVLMSKIEIQIAIEEEKANLAALAGLTKGYLVKNLKEIVDSDRARCCRYCWGIEHGYQWTQREYSRALNEALDAGLEPPDIKGGFGFTKKREPCEECPVCHGDGLLPATLEPTKKADKIKAADLLSKLGGFVVERKELTVPGVNAPKPAGMPDFNSMSDAELEAFAAGTNPLAEGAIEGTLALPSPNSSEMSEIEADSSP